MDISPFSLFAYEDKDAWHDFLLVNGVAHENYNSALENLGIQVAGYPIIDVGDTQEAKQDWLATHYLMHLSIAASLGIVDMPDLTDVELHDPEQFTTWLQLHQQQHQVIDATLNL